MKKLLAEMDEKLGALEVAYNTMQYKNEQALKEKDARIAELETTLKWSILTAHTFKERIAELEEEKDNLQDAIYESWGDDN